jgi:hypothetical protein
LLTFGGFVLGCAHAPPSPARSHDVERAAVTRTLPMPARVLASGCRAEPATVYGDEPVVFEIQGPRSAPPVSLELRDESRQVIAQGQASLPGQWRPSAVQSGDFRLAVAQSDVSCWVTVNRELSRATGPAR